jgi:Tfp pilus assembly protein PilO
MVMGRKRWAVDRQQLLILLVGAVMAGSFVLLVLWPRQEELVALGSEVTRQRDLVSQKVRVSQEGVYVSARIAALRKIQDQLLRRLPEEPRLADFLEDVAALVGQEPGVTYEVERTEAEWPGPVPAAPVRLRLTGPFAGVHRCLAGIEGLERRSQVQRLLMNRMDESGNVTAEVDVFVFYLPSEPAAGQRMKAAVQPKAEAVRG